MEDSAGRAGMVAVVLPAGENCPQDMLVVAGGANFPYAKPGAATPEERGKKVFYADVAVADNPGKLGQVQLISMGKMPYAVAYAAYAGMSGGMLVAGGCNAEGHLTKTSLSFLRDGQWITEALPDLPRSVAYPAFAAVGNKLFVMGGQEKPDSTTALSNCYVLDLDNTSVGWRELASMPDERMLAAAGVVDGVIYVVGGCSLHPSAKGEPERTYLNDILCYDPVSDTWARVAGSMPETLVGVASPLPAAGQSILIIGGDPGDFYRASLAGNAPAKHPGQANSIYVFTPSTGAWVEAGKLPEGIATFPAVIFGGRVLTVSGEIFPGVRTPHIYAIPLNQP